jgi:hypothetical protein
VRPLIVLAGLSYVLQGGASAPPAVLLPPVALEAADAGVVALAYVLARARVPAGIVTTDNPSRFEFARSARGLDATAAVPIADVLSRFLAAHAGYSFEWRDGVLGIAERSAVCGATARNTRVGPVSFSSDASKVLVFLTWMARGQPGQPRGTTGSILGNLSDLEQPLPQLSFVLKQATPLTAAFDQVVRSANGGVWFAWQHTRPDGRLACRSVAYWPTGIVSAPDDDFSIAGA